MEARTAGCLPLCFSTARANLSAGPLVRSWPASPRWVAALRVTLWQCVVLVVERELGGAAAPLSSCTYSLPQASSLVLQQSCRAALTTCYALPRCAPKPHGLPSSPPCCVPAELPGGFDNVFLMLYGAAASAGGLHPRSLPLSSSGRLQLMSRGGAVDMRAFIHGAACTCPPSAGLPCPALRSRGVPRCLARPRPCVHAAQHFKQSPHL